MASPLPSREQHLTMVEQSPANPKQNFTIAGKSPETVEKLFKAQQFC
jgi:hypothetical protein